MSFFLRVLRKLRKLFEKGFQITFDHEFVKDEFGKDTSEFYQFFAQINSSLIKNEEQNSILVLYPLES